MDSCFNDFYVHNGLVYSKEKFYMPKNPDAILYEVIRILDSTPLFINDHLNRLAQSVTNKYPNLSNALILKEIENDILLLIKSNSFVDGNIKYIILVNNGKVEKYAFYIQHSYPGKEMYKEGVVLKSFQAIRKDPNTKIVHKNLKEQVDNLLLDKEIYEILLLNEQNCITEGSRSNIFFICGGTLYTAPDDKVLKGITRQYAITIAKLNKIPLEYKEIYIDDLKNYDAAFLTGTSPRILPVCKIDSFNFNVSNKIMNKLIIDYNTLIDNYIKQHK